MFCNEAANDAAEFRGATETLTFKERLRRSVVNFEEHDITVAASQIPLISELQSAVNKVVICSADQAGYLHVRMVKHDGDLALVHREIALKAQQYFENPQKICGAWKTGEYCITRDNYGRSSRGKILQVSGNRAECFLLDHGVSLEVDIDTQLAPIDSIDILAVPFMAIKCRLVGIEPVSEDDEGEYRVEQTLHRLAFDDDGERRVLHCRVCFADGNGSDDHDTDPVPAILLGHMVPGLTLGTFINRTLVELALVNIREEEARFLNLDNFDADLP